MKPARGDGFCPRNVSLGMLRGENRPPRAVPRHLQDTHVTEGPEGTDSGFGLSPLECPEPCMSWNAPREKPQHLANLPWAVPVRMCCGMSRGANALTVRDSPLAGVAASVVSLGFSRVTWQARLPREVPRGTDSAPEPSPLVRLAAKTVPLGRSRATCQLPAAISYLPPGGRNQLAGEFTR